MIMLGNSSFRLESVWEHQQGASGQEKRSNLKPAGDENWFPFSQFQTNEFKRLFTAPHRASLPTSQLQAPGSSVQHALMRYLHEWQ